MQGSKSEPGSWNISLLMPQWQSQSCPVPQLSGFTAKRRGGKGLQVEPPPQLEGAGRQRVLSLQV